MPDPREDPNWPRASAWLAGEHLPDPVGSLGLVGAPLNCSITRGRFDLAPERVRQVLRRFGTYDVDNELDVRRLKLRDLGNAPISGLSPEEAREPLSKMVQRALSKDEAVVMIG